MTSETKSFFVLWNGSDDTMPRDERESLIDATANGLAEPGSWSFGRGYGDPERGDRVYLLRTGNDRGLIGSATIVEDGVYEDHHWSGEGVAYYVELLWDVMLDDEDRIPTDVLDAALPEQHFPVQASGTRIKEPSAADLAELWEQHLSDLSRRIGNPWLGGRPTTVERPSGPIPLQRSHVRHYDVTGFAGGSAARAEAEAVERLAEFLRQSGAEPNGYRMVPGPGHAPLLADLYDRTNNVLYEAKASSSREAVRMALGQLMDYRRFVIEDPELAVLLPVRPSADLVELLAEHRVRCVVPTSSGTFEDVEPAPSTDEGRVVAACRNLGDPAHWFRPLRYRDGLALAIIDSIQSTGAHYTSVRNVLDRYRAVRGEAAATDGTEELLETFDAAGGADQWATTIGNRKPASTRAGASLKATVIEQVARALTAVGVRTAEDLRDAVADRGDGGERYARVKNAWTSVEAQSSGITWNYALMLIGIPGVKADRMVLKFVSDALGRTVTATEAAALVSGAASSMGVDVIDLDHAMWRFASGRPVEDPSEQR